MYQVDESKAYLKKNPIKHLWYSSFPNLVNDFKFLTIFVKNLCYRCFAGSKYASSNIPPDNDKDKVSSEHHEDK